MQDNFKIKSVKVSFLLLIISLTFFSLIIFGFFKLFGWGGWPGLSVLGVMWLLIFFSTIVVFPKRKDGLIIDDFGLHLIQLGQSHNVSWSEIEKIGFQAVAAKRMGVLEVFPYLAISLKNNTLLNDISSSGEFGFLCKKSDFSSYMDQNDISDLYVSMKFASEDDHELPTYLSQKTTFISKINPLVKTDNVGYYQEVLKNDYSN